jgi:DNA-binding NtrC family response regulator
VSAARILVAEDLLATRERLDASLRAAGFSVVAAADGAEALERFEQERFDLVLSDQRMPRLDGLGLLLAVRRLRTVPFILYSSDADPEIVFRAGRLGAVRFLTFPFGVREQLLPTIAESLAAGSTVGSAPARGAERFLGVSAAAERLRSLVQRLGPRRCSVLIQGETGVGKEVVAQAIHEESGRGSWRAFAATELADTLVETELFGHERGAFTGAVAARPGLFEQAHDGTLFLDEIGDASPSVQAKLLRVLETGELRRVGGTRTRCVDVRVLAATNRDLEVEVRAGRFRHDLLFRLRQASIRVPPLRDRPEDVEVLARAFLAQHARRGGSPAPVPGEAFLAGLRGQPWPGNARELRSVIGSALVWWDGRSPLGPADLLEALASMASTRGPDDHALCQRMIEAYRRAGGSQEAARRSLGLSRAAWRHRWRRFGLAALGARR